MHACSSRSLRSDSNTAPPTRDGAVVGFSASTALTEAMGVYLRYEGTIAGQDSSHALTAGLRMTW
jgi:uncharacterized protein with beta-barrel porin domain